MQSIISIFGTRPEIIKMAPLLPLLDNDFPHKFVFTSQHYSWGMMRIFFKELGTRKPDKYLNVKSSNIRKLEDTIRKEIEQSEEEWVLVYGDTNSTYAAARAAKRAGKRLIHVEAGLRAYDSRLPEERNRKEIDHMSDILFAPTDLAKKQLAGEGITKNVFVVGNTVVDAVGMFSGRGGKHRGEYILVTAHRQENVDKARRLMRIMGGISQFPKVIFPIHPRTLKRIKQFGLDVPGNVKLVEPTGYRKFLELLKGADVVLTDSGGVQEEAITLGVPCLTLRESTERWESVEAGGNFVVGLDPLLINSYVRQILDGDLGRRMRQAKNPYGKDVSKKIVSILKRKLR